MKVNSLKPGLLVLAFSFGLLLSLISCGESDNSGNNSTTTTETDTIGNVPGMDNPDSANRTPSQKRGKITVTPSAPTAKASISTDANGYYSTTETAPVYGGGPQALETYFNNNIDFPQEAIDNNVEGTVMVAFTIDEDGTVGNAKVTSPKLGYGLDEAAVRVVNSMQTWTAGTIKGKKVKAWYSLPVTFRME